MVSVPTSVAIEPDWVTSDAKFRILCRIFIVNGLMTVFLALLGRILIVDFPDKVYKSRMPFLKPQEVKAVQDKLDRDRQDAEYDELTKEKFIAACARWELWFL
jgi:hypothetical protein